MGSTTFDDKDNKENTKPNPSSDTNSKLGVPAEDAFARVLTGCCVFCAEPLTPHKIEFYKEPLVSGRTFICASAKCEKEWDSMSLANLQWIISTRVNFG